MEKQSGKTVKFEFNELTAWKSGTIVFGVLFIISLLSGGFSFDEGDSPSAPSVPSAAPTPTAQERVEVKAGNAFFKGEEDAPVTIIEYSDFQCPFCGRFYEQTLDQIEKEYIETGKARLVYKHLPLSFHENAQIAAEASECAGIQGKFWEMHDKIFDNQQAIAAANLKTYAAEIGLDTNKFNSCLDNGNTAEKVNKHNAEAASLGASGTPTFFINGQKLVGAQPFAAFKTVIDAELAK